MCSGYLVTGIGLTSIAPPAPPLITNVTAAGGNIILGGSGGTPSTTYYLAGSTNVTQPRSNWTHLATNQFNGAGNFLITNPVMPGSPHSFYQLKLP